MAKNNFLKSLEESLNENKRKNSSDIKEAAKEAKKIMDKFDEITNKISKNLKKCLKKVCLNLKKKNGTINFNFALELFLKLTIALILIVLFKIPFEFINDFGKFFIEIFISPLNKVLPFIWKLILFIIYIFVSILILLSMFSKYFDKKDNFNPVSLIIKIIGTLVFLIPIWFTNFILVLITIFLIYLLFEGVTLVGLLVMAIGLSLLIGLLADIIESLIYTSKKIYIFPFIISAILIIVGSVIFDNNMENFEYINIPSQNIEKKEFTYESTTKEKIEIKDANINIDEELEDGKFIIKIDYYDVLKPNIINSDNKILIEFSTLKTNTLKTIINDLKQNKIYNYKKTFKSNINIYVNSNTSKLIET